MMLFMQREWNEKGNSAFIVLQFIQLCIFDEIFRGD